MNWGAVVDVIVWNLNLQMPMESVPITTNIVGSTPAQGEMYNIMWQQFSVTYGRSMVFSGYFSFLHQYNWQPRYNWNIVSDNFYIKSFELLSVHRSTPTTSYLNL